MNRSFGSTSTSTAGVAAAADGDSVGQLSQGRSIKILVGRLCEHYDVKENQFNVQKLKSLKLQLKLDAGLIGASIDGLFTCLRRDDCETRQGAVSLANELFIRSHQFRTSLIDQFQNFLMYTAETDPVRKPLPLPVKAAKQLKKFTLKTVQQWHEKYGPAYRKLQLGYDFLLRSKSSDFALLNEESTAERRRQEEEETRKTQIRDRLLQKIEDEIKSEFKNDVESTLTEVNNAFDLLYPSFTLNGGGPSAQKSKPTEPTDDQQPDVQDLRDHGFRDNQDSVEITIDFKRTPIELSEDNQALLTIIKDSIRTIQLRLLPKVSKWMGKVAKVGGLQQLTKELIDYKNQLKNAVSKFTELNVIDMKELLEEAAAGEDGDDEDEFEDVQEKDLSDQLGASTSSRDEVPSYMFKYSKKVVKSSGEQLSAAADTSSSSNNNNNSGANGLDPPTKKTDNDGGIPTLAYGIDLKYWGRESEMEEPSIVRNTDDSHPLWAEAQQDVREGESRDIAATNFTRVITFTGSFGSAEIRECRALLKNGGLCNRKDRRRCPFHGKIIHRDSEGKPVEKSALSDIDTSESESETAGPSKTSNDNKVPDWQDPELLQEIKDKTGTDLTIGRRKDKPYRGKYRKKDHQITVNGEARQRLSTKLFDKKSLKRVGATLDEMQKKRNELKYSHQFNYLYKH